MTTDGSERRQYFRIQTCARIGARVVAEDQVEAVRARVLARHVSQPYAVSTTDDRGGSPEVRALFELLERVALALDRIDRQLEALTSAATGRTDALVLGADRCAIVLSASGLRAPLDRDVADGDAVELLLDLSEAGLPLIHALARAVRTQKTSEGSVVALNFEALTPEDRERIVQLSLRQERRQSRPVSGEGEEE